MLSQRKGCLADCSNKLNDKTRRENRKEVFTQIFSTSSGESALPIVSFLINVEMLEGEYDIRLTELTDSNPKLNSAEKITKILFLGKKLENGLYVH